MPLLVLSARQLGKTPRVRKSYYQLAEEIERQWNFAIDAMGMTFEPWRYGGQPYATNSAEMCGDIRHYHHLFFPGRRSTSTPGESGRHNRLKHE